jgi:hypothetical protein
MNYFFGYGVFLKMILIRQHSRQLNFLAWGILLMVFGCPFTGIGLLLAADPMDQIRLELPPPDTPQPQLFCGYCHVLTYPGVVQKGYELWKKGKHNKYGCVECHYPPAAAKESAQPTTVASTESKHIPAKPPEHFSYLPLGGETIMTRPRIADASCMTAVCHGKPDDKFKTKKIKFTEKVTFIHQPHLEKKNQIEGQQINCTSCHQHETDEKKFEVTQASCHLCHFNNTEFNEGRGKCSLCHELPEKPIQTSGEKPITHKMLEEAKVPCASCHIELIQASGGGRYEAYFEKGELKTTLVLDAGLIKKENCLACHDRAKELKESKNKKLMHQKHVAIKNARCFDCHQPIMHTKAVLELPATDDKKPVEASIHPVNANCEVCHPQSHRYQHILATGLKREGVLEAPDPMYKSRTNCLGCHMEIKINEKGQKVLWASDKTCVQCHTKDHKKMFKDWKTELTTELKYAREIEQEALEALKKGKGKLDAQKLADARRLLGKGRENLNIVKFGNGVHNKKYSIILIDAAITHFDEMIETLEAGD